MTPVRAAPDDVGLDCLCGSPIRHDGLEMRRENFSMSAVIVQNERPTTRSYLSKLQGWACRWAMERLAS